MYKNLEILNKINHKNKSLKEVKNFFYAQKLTSAPITVAEFFEACKNYPIFFAKDKDNNWFASVILGYKENNNLFGMKLPERRATLALGVKKGHAYYRDWKESIIDYSLYQMAYMRGLTEEEYFERLSKSYAMDEYYIKKLRQLKQKLSR